MNRYIIKFLLFLFTINVNAQDSLVIMHYNLLNYGNYTGYCSSTNNNHITKEGYLRTIFNYVQPDIFTVNEISNLNFYHDRLLTEVINTNGRTTYKRAIATNNAGSDIINMLYYDTAVLALKSSNVIQSFVRDINLYQLYYKNSDLSKGDTVYLNCIVAHLKAGSDHSDELMRNEMAFNSINWLNNNKQQGNYLLMGDFNLYTSEEPAYQTFTSISAGEFQFYDPVNAPGNWNNNPLFSHFHTQSVSNSGSGCQATGGMDDRFDFILISDYIVEGAAKIRYKAGSYSAIGQDGMHFNQSITNPPNNSVPSDVLSALGKMSDHLPVKMTLDLLFEQPGSISDSYELTKNWISKNTSDEIIVHFNSKRATTVNIGIINLSGQIIRIVQYEAVSGSNSTTVPIKTLPKGYYIVYLQDEAGNRTAMKFIN